MQELQGEAEAASKAREMTAKEKAEVEQKLVVANEDGTALKSIVRL